MGCVSKYLLTAFEITNELYTAVGAGLLGLAVLLKHGFQHHQYVKTFSVVAFTTCCLVYINQEKEKLKPSKKRVVVITGCDSGLGFSLAQHAVQLGFTVIAGFLSLDSKGCKDIKQQFGSDIIQIQLDITDSNSVQASVQTLEHFLGRNPGYTLHAIINNAGVMVFGEFEWLTERLIHQQLEVNIMGTFKFTNAMCPLLRRYKGRVITITSHCSQAALPGLSVYGSTKAALVSWSSALRIEMAKYGVTVITFIPGSFITQSNIMARQLQNVQEMHDAFTPEQHSFYSDYFKSYNMYLSFLAPPPKPVKIEDDGIYKVFERTLVDRYPDFVYKTEPLRYWFYHLLFKVSPLPLRDYFVKRFLQMPEYVPAQTREADDDIDDIDD